VIVLAAYSRASRRGKVGNWRGWEVDRTCADGDPSARIHDCARTKKLSVRNRGSLKKAGSTAFAFIQNRVFGTDTFFIRTKHTVGARSAQWSLLARSGIEAPPLEIQ
jgi:hypothetical protein